MAERKVTSLGTGLNGRENLVYTLENKPKALSPRSSLIPTLTVKKARQPLTPIQKSGRTVDNDMVKAKKPGDVNGNPPSSSKSNLTQIQKGNLVKQKSKIEDRAHRHDGKTSTKSRIPNAEGVNKDKVSQPKEKVFSDQVVQTENPDLDLVTGDVAPSQYYEQLAETRREALEESLAENKELWEENEKLREKVEKLEQENAVLIELVGVEKVEEFYNSVNQLDETGIGADVSEDEDMWATPSTGSLSE